jgi:2-aminoethylphosphonate-pyruvate transaminase
VLVEGMRGMGFRTLLPDELQAPVIVTFLTPADPRFDFDVFYEALRRRGYLIYPGKLTVADSFRIGCIGRLTEAEMRGALNAIRATLDEMGVRVPVGAAR